MGDVFQATNTIYFSGVSFNGFELIALFVFMVPLVNLHK